MKNKLEIMYLYLRIIINKIAINIISLLLKLQTKCEKFQNKLREKYVTRLASYQTE